MNINIENNKKLHESYMKFMNSVGNKTRYFYNSGYKDGYEAGLDEGFRKLKQRIVDEEMEGEETERKEK